MRLISAVYWRNWALGGDPILFKWIIFVCPGADFSPRFRACLLALNNTD